MNIHRPGGIIVLPSTIATKTVYPILDRNGCMVHPSWPAFEVYCPSLHFIAGFKLAFFTSYFRHQCKEGCIHLKLYFPSFKNCIPVLYLRVRTRKLVFLFLNLNICCDVVGTQKNCLNETVLLSIQNIC